jgi:hypothetical protein
VVMLMTGWRYIRGAAEDVQFPMVDVWVVVSLLN